MSTPANNPGSDKFGLTDKESTIALCALKVMLVDGKVRSDLCLARRLCRATRSPQC